MDNDKYLLSFILLFCYIFVALAVFIFFIKNDSSKTVQLIEDKIGKSNNESLNTENTNKESSKYAIGPTTVLEKRADQNRKNWIVYTNKKYNYSISIPNTHFMSNADIDKTLIYKKSTDKSIEKEPLVIYTFSKDKVPDIMKSRYKYLKPGDLDNSQKSGDVVTRLNDQKLSDGNYFRIYQTKTGGGELKSLEYVLDSKNIYTYISAPISKEGITYDQIKEIVSTYKLL